MGTEPGITPHAVAETSRFKCTTEVKCASDDFFIMVLEDDAICVPHDRSAFEAIIDEENFLFKVFSDRNTALNAYSEARIRYAEAKARNENELFPAKYVDAAQRELNVKRDAYFNAHALMASVAELFTETKASSKLPGISAGVKEIIVARKNGGAKHTWVRSEVIKNHFRTYRLSHNDTKSGQKSFINQGKIDWQTFKAQFSKNERAAKVKSQLPWVGQWLKKGSLEAALAKWTTAYNHGIAGGGEVNFSAEAQFVRLGMATNGATYEFEPKKAKFTTKLDAMADITLGECKVSAAMLLPRDGILLQFEDINLGHVRASLTMLGSAGVGATLAGALAIEVDASGSKISGLKGTLTTLRSTEPGSRANLTGLPVAKAGLSGSVFAGATVDVAVAGAIEWKSPEAVAPPHQPTFIPLASVKPGLAGLAGAGAQADFRVDFDGRRFRVFCQAALCWGVGAKGGFGFEVDGNQISNFIAWAYHQFKNSNYKLELAFIAADAVLALCNLQLAALCMLEGVTVKNAVSSIYQQLEKFSEAVMAAWNDEQSTIALMENINHDPDLLRFTLPEAKGRLLWKLISSPGWAKTLLLQNQFDQTGDFTDFKFVKDFRPGSTPRKRAVILLFTWVQSKAEFDLIMTKIKRMPDDPDLTREQGFRLVEAFLDEGEGWSALAPWLTSDYDGNLNRFYQRLKDAAPVGYPVVKNSMAEYLTLNEVAPYFLDGQPQPTPHFNATLMARQQAVNSSTDTYS